MAIKPAKPLRVEFEVPNNCPPDIELMSIWAQAYERYAEKLNDAEFQAAVTWFRSYIDAKTRPAVGRLGVPSAEDLECD